LLTIQSDDTTIALLRESEEYSADVSVSPDGGMIYLYPYTASFPREHYVFDVTERVLRPLTDRQGRLLAGVADWSPNGDELLPVIDLGWVVAEGTYEGMYAVNVHTGQSRLIRKVDVGEIVFMPRYSPDGSRIVFHVYEQPEQHSDEWTLTPSLSLRVTCADGTNEVQIAPPSLFNPTLGPPFLSFARNPALPAWSPRGGEILFHAWFEDEEQGGIYIVNADGSDLRKLVDTGDASLEPFGINLVYMGWVPDGQRFAYSLDGKVWTQNVDGTDRIDVSAELGDTSRRYRLKGWTHDGRLVIEERAWSGKPSTLYIVDLESGELKELLSLEKMCLGSSDLVWAP